MALRAFGGAGGDRRAPVGRAAVPAGREGGAGAPGTEVRTARSPAGRAV
ncbi:hypothetical protein GCM10010421_50390 [Streptomyces glaucus]|uniref:Uncharacterized protein n=1 Tax=Streptomyces glaucus TaxID=284029 RepID=A0ABP5XCI2_9ACTN